MWEGWDTRDDGQRGKEGNLQGELGPLSSSEIVSSRHGGELLGRRACGIDITNNCRPERLSQESVHSKLPTDVGPISYGALTARVPYSLPVTP